MDAFGLIARYYDRVFRYPGPEGLLAALQPEPGHRILDIGGGTGRVSGTFGDALHVVVCDPSAGMLGQALGKGLHACACVAEQLPFATGSFPRIILVDTFHHVADQRQMVRELRRVLVPGGRWVIEEPDIRQRVVQFVALAERLLRVRSRFFSLPDMLAMLEEAGATILAVEEGPGANVRVTVVH